MSDCVDPALLSEYAVDQIVGYQAMAGTDGTSSGGTCINIKMTCRNQQRIKHTTISHKTTDEGVNKRQVPELTF